MTLKRINKMKCDICTIRTDRQFILFNYHFLFNVKKNRQQNKVCRKLHIEYQNPVHEIATPVILNIEFQLFNL